MTRPGEDPRVPSDDPSSVGAVLDVLASLYGAASLPAEQRSDVLGGVNGSPADVVADCQRRAERLAGSLLLDRLPFALFAVDTAGTVAYGNEAAARLLAEGQRLRLGEGGRLHPANAGDAETLRAVLGAFAPAAAATAAQACQLTSADDGRRFGVLALRARGSDPPLVVLLTADPGREQALRALLRSMFGLTRAEAELCLLVVQGLSLDEAARTRRITASTARASWQSVTWKAGAPPAALLQILQAALVLPLDSVERVPGR